MSPTTEILSPFKASLMNESEIVNELGKDENIRYFKLPENNGWNSGRALLISQVQTEYFVWCDDDWIFHDETNLETMLVTRDSRTIRHWYRLQRNSLG